MTDNLTAEVTRATTAEQTLTDNLTAEVTRATTAEQSLAQDIADEELRASQEEGKISNSVIKETTRATKAESNITRHVFLVYDTYDELPTVQKDPDISVTIHTGQLVYVIDSRLYYSAIVTDGAVTWEPAKIPAIGVSDEQARAEAAEAKLTEDLAAETARATAAEQANTNAIQAEATRAKEAEKVLQKNIDNFNSIVLPVGAPANVKVGSVWIEG